MATNEQQRIAFVLELGKTLHRFGASAFRLEEVLSSVSRALELVKPQFFSTPTSLFASFGELGEQQTSLQRIEPGEIDLGKLADVDRLAEDVTAEDIIAYCRASMAHFKVPKTVVFGPLPKTSTGKILKYELRDKARGL